MPMPINPDLVVDDHVLHDAARIVGNAAIVANDELDLAARRRVSPCCCM